MSFLFIAIMNNHENVIGIDEHVLFAGSCAWRHAMAMVIIPWRQERLVRSTLGKPQQQEMGETGVEQKRRSFQPGNRLRKHTWLVVWSIFFYIYIYIYIYIGNNHPNWFSYFSEGWLNHHPRIFEDLGVEIFWVFGADTEEVSTADPGIAFRVFQWELSTNIANRYCGPDVLDTPTI